MKKQSNIANDTLLNFDNMEDIGRIMEYSPILLAISGPYGDAKFYTGKYVPDKMRDNWAFIPTDDARMILKWKKEEIEKSTNHKCLWKIKLSNNRIDNTPKMRYAIRTISGKNSIIQCANITKSSGRELYVIFIASGQPTKGLKPVANRLLTEDGSNYHLDINAEASECGDSIVLDEISVIPKGEVLNLWDYLIFDNESPDLPCFAVHFGRGHPISIVSIGDTSQDPHRYPINNRFREIVGIGRMAYPWCGEAVGDRLQKNFRT